VQTTVLPRRPFVVSDESGGIAKVLLETVAFWIEPEGTKSDRVFFQAANTFCIQEMPRELSNPGYIALFLSSSVCKWLSFIPGQYWS
jgi:hypothetical protein